MYDKKFDRELQQREKMRDKQFFNRQTGMMQDFSNYVPLPSAREMKKEADKDKWTKRLYREFGYDPAEENAGSSSDNALVSYEELLRVKDGTVRECEAEARYFEINGDNAKQINGMEEANKSNNDASVTYEDLFEFRQCDKDGTVREYTPANVPAKKKQVQHRQAQRREDCEKRREKARHAKKPVEKKVKTSKKPRASVNMYNARTIQEADYMFESLDMSDMEY